MVRENLIPNNTLQIANAARRNALMRQNYGISQDILDGIRRQPIHEAIKNAAEMLYDRGEALNGAGAAQVTGINLAAVALRHWRCASSASTAVENTLKMMFEEKKKEYNEDLGLNVPYNTLLLIERGKYKGNLIEAKGAYPFLQPSRGDWAREIRLPVTLDDKAGGVLADLWCDGSITQGRDSDNNIHLRGNKNDGEYYEQIIRPTWKDVFNLTLNISTQRPARSRKGNGWLKEGTYPDEGPVAQETSKAIAAWFCEYAGYRPGAEKKRPPHLVNSEVKRGFLTHAIGAMGSLSFNSSSGRPIIWLYDHDIEFLRQLHYVFNGMGLPLKVRTNAAGKSSGRFKMEDTQRIIEEGWLVNPRHLDAISRRTTNI